MVMRLAQNVFKIKNVVVKRLTLIINTEKCRRLRYIFGFYVIGKYLTALHFVLPFTVGLFVLRYILHFLKKLERKKTF
jgi:hypothetical protein